MAPIASMLLTFIVVCGMPLGQGSENFAPRPLAKRDLPPSPWGMVRGAPMMLHGWNRIPTEKAKQIEFGAQQTMEATRRILTGKVGGERTLMIQNMLSDKETIQTPNDSCDERNLPCPLGHRQPSGWCNNRRNPEFGASHRLLQRLLPAAYDDDVNAPRSQSVTGRPLPSPRKITTTVFGVASHDSNDRTLWMMQWGQFLDHDITRTPNAIDADGSSPDCSDCDSASTNSLCLPIMIPPNDPHFPPSKRCMNFVRSGNGRLSLGPREQINMLSAFVDASQIYGSDDCTAESLREMNDGLLRTSHNGQMLPLSNDNGFCRSESTKCFLAGDIRVNENVALTSLQTMWMLEHNRIATELKAINPDWDDETLYQETRKIIIAMIQHISYNEYIPKVVGPDLAEEFDIPSLDSGFYDGYDESVDASLLNEFSTAAYRFGHSLVQDQYEMRRGQRVTERLNLVDAFADPSPMLRPRFLDSIFSGLSTQSCQMTDAQFSETVRDRLFEGKNQPFSGFDLPAFNIQRGRDHGLPPYISYRQLFNLPVPRTFDDLARFMDSDTVQGLKRTYLTVDDIDLYVGIVSERPLRGAAVGPTAAHIIADQFNRLKRGDRYWYERQSVLLFKPEQLDEIRKITLAKVICTHVNINVQPDVFLKPTVPGNDLTDCDSLPGIDLNLWRVEE